MIRQYHIATMLVAASLTLSATQPAFAENQFSNMFKEFLNRQVPAQTGQAIDPIAQREADISNRMIAAINANKLTADQTQQLKAQFDSIRNLEAKYRANDGIDTIEQASLTAELNRLDSTFNQMTSGYNSTTINSSEPINNESLNHRLHDMSRTISENLANGRLTVNEARDLKADKDSISAKLNGRRENELSPMEASQVRFSLDQLQSKISSNVHDRQVWPGIDGAQAKQAAQIAEGFRDGRLTQREYNELKIESDRIAQEESQTRGQGLHLDETLTLATDLMNLHDRISTLLRNNVVTSPIAPFGSDGFDNHKEQIMRRIEKGVASGRLTQAEADDVHHDFRRLEQLESSYRAQSGGGLNPTQIAVLQRGLNNVMTELNDRLHDDVTSVSIIPVSDIDRRQAELRRRIDDGYNSGRLTAPQATSLRGSLEWIDSVETSMRRSGGRLDGSEEQNLSEDLDRLTAKLNRWLGTDNPGTNNPIQTIEDRKTELSRRIEQAAAENRLNPFEAQVMRHEFDRITWMQKRLTSDGRLDINDSAQIISELDKLNGELNRELNSRKVQ